MWSSAINYKLVPGNDRQRTLALIESIQYLVLRRDSVVQVRQQSLDLPDEPLCELLERIDETCIDSFLLISATLAEQRPVPDLSAIQSMIREVECREAELRQTVARDEDMHTSMFRFMSAAFEMRSLAGAIQDCRNKVNALDWVAWNRSYF